MRVRFLAWYTLLLVLPALLIAAMAARWLRHEEQRLDGIARAAVEERAAVQAGNLDLLLRETAEAVLASFSEHQPADADATHRWLADQPFARHAFAWHPEQGLLLPETPQASAEEQAFLRRYEALFSGRTPWPVVHNPEERTAPEPRRAIYIARQQIAKATQAPAPAAAPMAESGIALYKAEADSSAVALEAFSDRADAVAAEDEAGGAPAPAQALTAAWTEEPLPRAARAAPTPPPPAPAPASRGWLPWFWERDLHLLGWLHYAADGSMRGVELELLAVLARFQPLFAEEDLDGTAFALVDHAGQTVLQSARYEELAGLSAPIAVPVSEWLPNWQLRAAARPPAVAGHTPVLLAGLLVGIFLVAILSGGALLGWQGYRHYRDAARKTSFVSNVSHELKTPLTTIRMYAEMLREGRIRDDARKREYLDVVVAESQRLTRLVNNVLDFSRLEQRRKTYHAQPFDLAELVRSVLATQEVRLAAASLSATLELQTPSVPLHSDRDALEQVLLNLLDNAAKYAEGCGELLVSLREEAGRFVLAVADRGPGIPGAHAERIFESFHRVDNSLTARHPGSGLGLSIGRRIMRDLGGDLLYQPRPGGGALFTMLIPKAVPHG